jgi:hypothetical protein
MFDVETEVDDLVAPYLLGSAADDGAWDQQGTTLRDFINKFSLLSGAVYYFASDKKLRYKALEDVESRWGFSDRPNRDVVDASPVEYQGATYGFREGTVVRGGDTLVNDAFIWGGSEFSGDGATVFARETNTTSIADHLRMQMAEVHFGEEGFRLQSGVEARADVIVNGGIITEILPGSFNPGLAFEQWQVTLSWMSMDVPRIAGVPDHLKAGDLVTFVFYAFGADEDTPLILTLPLRSLSMSFVALEENGDAHVKYTGRFGLQLNDPHTLWRYLLREQRRIESVVAVTDGSSPAPYGAYFAGAPVELPDGFTEIFNLPGGIGYIGGTTEVYVSGLLKRRGTEYTESNPIAGEITFVAPLPEGTDWMWIVCRTV